MLKNKPWQALVLITIHTISLVYIIYRAISMFFIIANVYPAHLASIIIGIAALVYLLRGKLAGIAFELLYIISFLFYGFSHFDLLAYIAVSAVIMLMKPTRLYYGVVKNSDTTSKSAIISVAVTCAVVVAISGILIQIINHLGDWFYIIHSRSDHEKILAYIDKTYGNDVQINSSDYKMHGEVDVTLANSDNGDIYIVNNEIFDGIISSKLEEKYTEELNSKSTQGLSYYVSLLPAFGEDDRTTATISVLLFSTSAMTESEKAMEEVRDEKSLEDYYSRKTNEAKNDFVFSDNILYEVSCKLIDEGYRVEMYPSPGGFLSGIEFSVRQRSLLFPFLNPKIEDGVYTSRVAEFYEKCSKEEFFTKINQKALEVENIRSEMPRMPIKSRYDSFQRINFALQTVTFGLWSFAIYTLAKRRGLSKKWISWIPYVSVLMLAAISDDIGAKYERTRRYFKRALILFASISVCLIAIFLLKLAALRYSAEISNLSFSAFIPLLTAVLNIIYIVTMYQSLWYIYLEYAPKRPTLFLVLSILLAPFSSGIILFCIRNDTPLFEKTAPQYDEECAELKGDDIDN